MSKCRDCAHWDTEEDLKYQMDWRIGLLECKKNTGRDFDLESYPPDAAVMDGSGGEYHDCLYTGPEFGCVHFKERNDE
jgi:hypothetical protein